MGHGRHVEWRVSVPGMEGSVVPSLRIRSWTLQFAGVAHNGPGLKQTLSI